MKKLLFIILFAGGLFLVPNISSAQVDPPDDTEDVNAPFDGGLSLLIAAGVAYGAKKGYDKKKKDRSADNGQQTTDDGKTID